MKKYCLLVFAISTLVVSSFAQVGINNDNSAPDSAAMLDVKSTERGFLPPRMTFEQRNAIPNPVDGLMVYCLNCRADGFGTLCIYQSGHWENLYSYCEVPQTPSAGIHNPDANQIVWNWNEVPIAFGYRWNTIDDFASAVDLGQANSYTETGLNCWTSYSRYVWAYNDCGSSGYVSLVQATPMIPFSSVPTEGIHVSSTNQIIWNWSVVEGAVGYKWGITDDFLSATDLGLTTTKTETGLTCGNAYSRYVWAYDSCGYSEAVELSAATLSCYLCNDTLIINHQITNGVAPVDKTVDYRMVTDIPGETNKCWITKNLGATRQALAENDASEASAGWYWQFNRKQGYKHDGSTLTPAWSITNISENSDWQAAADPCNLELGTPWRLPTFAEWNNVDNAGGWTNWNGPWGSGLKLHAAGYLSYTSGSLNDRGTIGHFWSGAQLGTNNGWLLYFTGSNSDMGYTSKATGFSVRCLREF